MSQEELNEILDLHKKWLNGEGGGKSAFLRYANLVGTDLRYADLRRVDLYGANLIWVDLRGVNLSGADLKYANLCGTDLRDADLHGADMKGANLTGADLRYANLCDTDMKGAHLCGTDLRNANLCSTDLRNANLIGANLSSANMKDVKYNANTTFLALQCPNEGAFIAYKKVNNIIIKLEVPADAKRSSATTRKCRCSKAKVLGFYGTEGNELDITEVVNPNYAKTTYRKGEMVYPDKWNENRWNECSHGIHFFLTFDEAKNY